MGDQTTANCSACGAALREYAQRLICDQCRALFVPHAQFVEELGGSDVEIRGGDPVAAVCPRCATALRACEVRIDGMLVATAIAECPKHGLQFAPGDFADVIARHARMSPPPGPPGAAAVGLHVLHGPGVPFGLFYNVEGGGPDPLWFRRRKVKPLVATPFQSALRELRLACPDCAGRALEHQGDRARCLHCAGVFVETAALAQMIGEMTDAPWEPAPPSTTASQRACPACAGAMTIESLEEVVVDRCAVHGFWFDAGELADVLAQSAEPTGGWAKLRRRLLG